jgi:hypothetical protein
MAFGTFFLPFDIMAMVLYFLGDNMPEIAANLLLEDPTGPFSASLINYLLEKYPGKTWFFFMNSYDYSFSLDNYFSFQILHITDDIFEAFYSLDTQVNTYNEHMRIHSSSTNFIYEFNDAFYSLGPQVNTYNKHMRIRTSSTGSTDYIYEFNYNLIQCIDPDYAKLKESFAWWYKMPNFQFRFDNIEFKVYFYRAIEAMHHKLASYDLYDKYYQFGIDYQLELWESVPDDFNVFDKCKKCKKCKKRNKNKN